MGMAKEQILMDQSFLAQPAVGRVSIGVRGRRMCDPLLWGSGVLPDTSSGTLHVLIADGRATVSVDFLRVSDSEGLTLTSRGRTCLWLS